MAKHATEHQKKETPVDLQKALDAVSEACTDLCAKKDALRPLQAEHEKAEQAAADAEVKVKDAEDSLLKAARQHKREQPAVKPEAPPVD